MLSKFLIPSLLAVFCEGLCGQTTALPFRPVAAEYSNRLDSVIFISGNPNALHVYDASSNKDAVVPLSQPPLALSLSPDGLHAAVGHDALISYINLEAMTVERTYSISQTAGSVVLASEWVYVMPSYYDGSVSVHLASGAVTNNPVFYGSRGKLNTAVNAIYGTRDGITPNDIEEYDISTGPITRQFDSPYHGDYCIYGSVWFSPDGGRIYTGCGTVFRAAKDPAIDMYYVGTLPTTIVALSQSDILQRLAVIAAPLLYADRPQSDGVVAVLDSQFFKLVAQFTIPRFTVGGNTFDAHGKWVFYNSAATELIVVSQADNKSGLLNDFAIHRIQLKTPTSACGASLATTSANIAGSGGNGSVQVTAPDTCIYKATSSAPWLTIVSGGYGSGNGTLKFVAASNAGGPRAGTITFADQTITVVQAAADRTEAVAHLGLTLVQADYDLVYDRLILATASPDQLHIYDPRSNTDVSIALSLAPISVSTATDGIHAAVGHDGWVSYVNLQTAQVERMYQVSTDVAQILLADNGYIYLFPLRTYSGIYSLQISTGRVVTSNAIYEGRVPRLHPNRKHMYLGGDAFSKWDISNGTAKLLKSAVSDNTCGNIWLTKDGRRIFTACATAYTSSEIPEQDMQPNGNLSAASAVQWADNSAIRRMTAVLPKAQGFGTGPLLANDTVVQLYNDDFLGYLGAIPLPAFPVGTSSSPSHGRFVFWNAAGSELLAVIQPDQAAGTSSEIGIARLSLSALVNPLVATVVNAATQAGSRVSPGELVSIYGANLGPERGVAFTLDPVTNRVYFELGGTQVFFDGIPAPVLYASNAQVNAIVPFNVSTPGTTRMQLSYQGVLTSAATIFTASSMPGIFTTAGSGSGQAVAVNQDGTICDASHPAHPGSYITLYITGGGYTTPPSITGNVAGSVLKRFTQTVLATVGGKPATVTFAGAAPSLLDGVGQVNLKLADDTPVGLAQPLILTVGINSSPNTTTIAVR